MFLLYTRLAAIPQTETTGGLGYVDSRSPVLNVKVELDLSTDQPTSHRSRKKNPKGNKSRQNEQNTVIEVELAQDPSSLRSRKGNTGSVLWRVRSHSFRSMGTVKLNGVQRRICEIGPSGTLQRTEGSSVQQRRPVSGTCLGTWVSAVGACSEREPTMELAGRGPVSFPSCFPR